MQAERENKRGERDRRGTTGNKPFEREREREREVDMAWAKHCLPLPKEPAGLHLVGRANEIGQRIVAPRTESLWRSFVTL